MPRPSGPSSDASSGATVRLPHTWRPLGARLVGTVLGALLIATVLGAWFAFSPSDRAKFDGVQRGTLVFFGLIALGVWFALMRCRVTASEDGVTVVNGYRRRDLEWAQVVNVSLGRGAPWAAMDLSDGTTISLLGIQGSDGDRAADAVRALRALVAERTAP